jgi:hypothetical protein
MEKKIQAKLTERDFTHLYSSLHIARMVVSTKDVSKAKYFFVLMATKSVHVKLKMGVSNVVLAFLCNAKSERKNDGQG